MIVLGMELGIWSWRCENCHRGHPEDVKWCQGCGAMRPVDPGIVRRYRDFLAAAGREGEPGTDVILERLRLWYAGNRTVSE
jgi:hypothetical protein